MSGCAHPTLIVSISHSEVLGAVNIPLAGLARGHLRGWLLSWGCRSPGAGRAPFTHRVSSVCAEWQLFVKQAGSAAIIKTPVACRADVTEGPRRLRGGSFLRSGMAAPRCSSSAMGPDDPLQRFSRRKPTALLPSPTFSGPPRSPPAL